MKAFHVEKNPATPRLIASEQNRVVVLDFLKIDQSRLLHAASLANAGKHLAQADHSEGFPDRREVGKRRNKQESFQLPEMNGVAELRKT